MRIHTIFSGSSSRRRYRASLKGTVQPCPRCVEEGRLSLARQPRGLTHHLGTGADSEAEAYVRDGL